MNYARAIVNFRDVVTSDSFTQKLKIGSKYPLTPTTSILMELKPSGDFQVETVLAFSTADGSITISGQEIMLSKTAQQMQVTPGKYVYNCQFGEGPTTTTLFGGIFEIVKDKTSF